MSMKMNDYRPIIDSLLRYPSSKSSLFLCPLGRFKWTGWRCCAFCAFEPAQEVENRKKTKWKCYGVDVPFTASVVYDFGVVNVCIQLALKYHWDCAIVQ